MSPNLSSDPSGEHILHLPLEDKWQIYHRLQELMFECHCPPDGSLRVKINGFQEAIIIRSILMQFFASRHQLIAWLESCWSYNPE